jgi:hypothetical protein
VVAFTTKDTKSTKDYPGNETREGFFVTFVAQVHRLPLQPTPRGLCIGPPYMLHGALNAYSAPSVTM